MSKNTLISIVIGMVCAALAYYYVQTTGMADDMLMSLMIVLIAGGVPYFVAMRMLKD